MWDDVYTNSLTRTPLGFYACINAILQLNAMLRPSIQSSYTIGRLLDCGLVICTCKAGDT